jgi:hypothetical protein
VSYNQRLGMNSEEVSSLTGPAVDFVQHGSGYRFIRHSRRFQKSRGIEQIDLLALLNLHLRAFSVWGPDTRREGVISLAIAIHVNLE